MKTSNCGRHDNRRNATIRTALRAGYRRMAVTSAGALILLASTGQASAALIEIPSPAHNTRSISGAAMAENVEGPVTSGDYVHNRAATHPPVYAWSDRSTAADVRAAGLNIHVLHKVNGARKPDSAPDVAAAASVDRFKGDIKSVEDPGTEFWALLLIVAGLIVYQVRRKFRTGFIRIPPFQP